MFKALRDLFLFSSVLGCNVVQCFSHVNWGPAGGGVTDLGITWKSSVFSGGLLKKRGNLVRPLHIFWWKSKWWSRAAGGLAQVRGKLLCFKRNACLHKHPGDIHPLLLKHFALDILLHLLLPHELWSVPINFCILSASISLAASPQASGPVYDGPTGQESFAISCATSRVRACPVHACCKFCTSVFKPKMSLFFSAFSPLEWDFGNYCLKQSLHLPFTNLLVPAFPFIAERGGGEGAARTPCCSAWNFLFLFQVSLCIFISTSCLFLSRSSKS